jgi:predicted DCC family thiol-disulfide oxidoreductase YuxK
MYNIKKLMQRGSMPKAPVFPITVFYDGSCVVCSTEIEQYRSQDYAGRLILVDISAADFNPERYAGTLQAFMFELHVIDRNGHVYRGVEAFWAIWQVFPASTLYGLMGTVIMLPLLNPLARLCYQIFARVRRYLPKRKLDCASGSCRIGKIR